MRYMLNGANKTCIYDIYFVPLHQQNKRIKTLEPGGQGDSREKSMMTMTFKKQMTEIMNLAWRINRVTGEQFAECLKKAWMNYKLRVAMMSRIVRFAYIKKSTGELRTAIGTTDPHRYDYTPTGNGRNGNFADCVQYYDKEADGFRMFKTYNLVSVTL